MSKTNSLAAEARLALYTKYGSMWKAALAYDPQYCGGRLLRKLEEVPTDPMLAFFVQKNTGIDLTKAPEHQEAINQGPA